ncbi:MAG: glycosyltransferase family 4 protein [Acidobacteria bacterium]|nr:glycosyltransferase family 4 protein [Acidobacteriota bacterium]
MSRFAAAGHDLVPVEFYGGLLGYGWTKDDAERPREWRCLFPDRMQASRTRVFLELARLVRRERIGVVVINGWFEPVSWWMALTRRRLGVRLVMIGDSTAADRRRRPVAELGKRMFLRRMDAVFTAGTRQRAYLRTLGVSPARVTLGCDVVDNARFAACNPHTGARASAEGGQRRIVIGTAARLIAEKNLDVAIRAFASVAKAEALALAWRLAGRGPLEEGLQALAASVEAPIEFAGFVPHGGMPGFYTGLDLYWQPSVSEAWGLSINEAMAAGLPVLASNRCGCADDLVRADNGWTHGPSVEELEEGLRAAIARRESWRDMGRRSRDRIAAWGPERFAAGLLDAVQLAQGAATLSDRPATRHVELSA